MKVGILCNGRHTGTKDWEGVVWERDGKMGQIPTALAVMRDQERMGNEVVAFVFGTGASERNGLLEAQVMRNYMLDNFYALPDAFPVFAGISTKELIVWKSVLCEILVVETTSKNTIQEVAAAMRIFEKLGAEMVIDVTCRTHAPRCRRDIDTAMEQNAFRIPIHRVSVVSSETHYAGIDSSAEVGILEPPHRGDTPEVFERFHEVMMNICRHFLAGNSKMRDAVVYWLRRTSFGE